LGGGAAEDLWAPLRDGYCGSGDDGTSCCGGDCGCDARVRVRRVGELEGRTSAGEPRERRLRMLQNSRLHAGSRPSARRTTERRVSSPVLHRIRDFHDTKRVRSAPPDTWEKGETRPDTTPSSDGFCRDARGDYCDCCERGCLTGPCFEDCPDDDCETLKRPSGKAASGSCIGEMKGSDSECEGFACDVQYGLPDIDAYAEDDQPFTISDHRSKLSSCDSEFESMLKAAWGVLLANVRLVEWALCWVLGPDHDNCMVAHIAGSALRKINIDLLNGKDWYDPEASATTWCHVDVNLYVDDDMWQTYLSHWCCGDAVDRACVAFSVSITLCHELTHYCCLTADPKNVLEDCARAYMIQNTFAWALYRRYPDLAASECCAQLVGDDGMFGDGRINRNTYLRYCNPISCEPVPGGGASRPKGNESTSTKYDPYAVELPERQEK